MSNNEFFVGRFHIDMQRNQVVTEGDTLPMEPKVLQVLYILAEHQGEVVSHQQIADKVWPDSIVVPNALQRCIAQLRKAFGDDAKRQAVIVTHAKKGYSLVADVTWKSDQAKHKKNISTFPLQLFGGVLSILLLIAGYLITFKEDGPIVFNKLTPLTSTDKPEFFSSFSPDGRYVAFTRNDTLFQSDLWVRDIENKREYQITYEQGHASQPAWSPNGDNVAFILDTDQGSYVASIYFPLAKEGKHQAKHLYSCVSTTCNSVQWLSDRNLTFVEGAEEENKILNLSVESGQSETLFQRKKSMVYSMSYSSLSKTLAFMLLNDDKKHELLLLNPTTQEIDSVPFRLTKGNDYWQRWFVKWNHTGDGFIVSTDSRMLHLSLSGKITQQPIPTYKYVLLPEYHPDGNSIALTLGYVDRDVTEISWSQNLTSSQETLHRSYRRESNAQYQPNGNGMAFLSDKSGNKQLWYSDGEQLTQLTDVKEDQKIIQYLWSPDGRQLIVLVNEQLYLTDLNGSWKQIDVDINAIKIFQWQSNDTLLMAMFENKQFQLIELNLIDSHVEPLIHQHVLWAQRTPEGQVIASDKNGKFINVVNAKFEPITALADHPTFSRFHVRNNNLYLITQGYHLWSYSLATAQLNNVAEFDLVQVAFGDIDPANNRMLVTSSVATNKDIVLLHN